MRKQLALAVSAALALGILMTPQTANAATSSRTRVVPLVASSNFVIYRQQSSTKDLVPGNYSGGKLYLADGRGQGYALPGFDGSRETPKLVVDSLVQAKVASYGPYRQSVHYRNLTTGEERTVLGAENEFLVSAARGGWVTSRAIDKMTNLGYVQELTQVNYDGSRESYGTPYPGGEDFAVVGSDSGLLAETLASDENHTRATVRFMAWGHPGVWKTIYQGAPDASVGCAPAAARWTACRVTGNGSKGLALISTTGRPIHWLKNTHPSACQKVAFATYGDNLVAIETSNAGVCTTGKLYRFNADKTLVSSGSKHYNPTAGILGGLNGIIVDKSDQSRIYRLSGVTRTPGIIARA